MKRFQESSSFSLRRNRLARSICCLAMPSQSWFSLRRRRATSHPTGHRDGLGLAAALRDRELPTDGLADRGVVERLPPVAEGEVDARGLAAEAPLDGLRVGAVVKSHRP